MAPDQSDPNRDRAVCSFEILGFPEPIDPDVVYLENMASALFLEEPEDITRHVARLPQ